MEPDIKYPDILPRPISLFLYFSCPIQIRANPPPNGAQPIIPNKISPIIKIISITDDVLFPAGLDNLDFFLELLENIRRLLFDNLRFFL